MVDPYWYIHCFIFNITWDYYIVCFGCVVDVSVKLNVEMTTEAPSKTRELEESEESEEDEVEVPEGKEKQD